MNSQIAREYRLKFPDMPNLTLARVMYKENVSVFKDVDSARSALRYIEGKKGARDKKYLKDKSLIMEQARPYNPYKLPESDETKYEPYIIKGSKVLGILSDVHVPYHSIEALTVALDEFKKLGVDTVLINGDFLDFHTLSRFLKDPRKKSFAHELETANQLLDIICQMFGKVVFKLGNHDERYEHYMMQKAPELLGVREFQLSYLLKAHDRKMDVVSDKRIIKAGKLNIIHGHEYPSAFSPVNIARGLYTKAKVCAIQGHNHQTSEHSETDMNGEITTTWSMGCLSELHPAYMPLNRWNHGAAVVHLDSDGITFHVDNFRIRKGKRI